MSKKVVTVDQVPLIQERDIPHVRDWLLQLENINLLWHMDDDAHDIEWTGFVVEPAALLQLEAQHLLACKICDDAGKTIWDCFPLRIPNKEQFIATREFVSGPLVEELGLGKDYDCMSYLIVYGSKIPLWNLTEMPDEEWPKLMIVEWVPPVDRPQPDRKIVYNRYEGHWRYSHPESGQIFGCLRTAENFLWEKYCRSKFLEKD